MLSIWWASIVARSFPMAVVLGVHVQGFIFPPPHLGGQTPGWPDPRRWPDRVARPFTRCWELASGAASNRGVWVCVQSNCG